VDRHEHRAVAPRGRGSATPTGEQVTFSVVSIFQGEEVAAHRMYLNQLPAMIQLGVVVPPEQPVEAG